MGQRGILFFFQNRSELFWVGSSRHLNNTIQSKMSSNDQQKTYVPSEMRISKAWDTAIEDTIIRASTGALVAGLASIVLFSKCFLQLEFISSFVFLRLLNFFSKFN
jgi:hypothetical protein